MGRGRVAAVGGWLALLLLSLPGCPPCEPQQLFAEDFEHCEAPCGWDVTLGSVERVETIHSSQHALQLAPGTTISRRISVPHDDPYPVDVSLVTDCAASQILLTVELTGEASSWVRDVELSSCSVESASVREERAPYDEICGALDRPVELDDAQGIVIEEIRVEAGSRCLVDGILLSYPTGGC
ncbi:MAG: hypothetical protein JRI23_28235 [Deltaproteobacteria bacterium]|nr:hypothetical protein [Deltaproteobacteria bacterium]MBW2535981.1 hypothetical protein [Deltaproteobacteria bacterium]